MAFTLFSFLYGNPKGLSADFTPNKDYHGFQLMKSQKIPEINSTGLLFVHTKSGARLLKLVADDDNKVFCISFKTPSLDDTGAAHILEHSVLNGSKNFPVKSPFNLLMKSSLNTFLNAMTAPDHTMYPVASRNDKDFQNLMHIYLDSVFYPNIYKEPMILQQEGWHYELDKPEGELTYNGVVYNEMKGAYSSPTRALYRVMSQHLYPKSGYRFESGGMPNAIPTLTQDKFLAFHQKYYHPSNSYIFLYGNGDTLSELKFINENYLNNFKKQKNSSQIALQKKLGKLQKITTTYPSTSDNADQTMLAYSIVGDRMDKELSFAMSILATVLVDNSSSILRKELIKANIGKDLFSDINSWNQFNFSIIAKNAKPEESEKFAQVITATLKKAVKDGLDKKQVEGALNTLEFSLREADFGSYPKGLVYNFSALEDWIYTDNPFSALGYEEALKNLRTKIKQGYLEKLIKKYLIDNKHAAFITVNPDRKLEQQTTAAEKATLSSIKKSLDKQQIAEIIKNAAELKKYQTTPDLPENLQKVPQLSRSDLDPKNTFYNSEKETLNNIDIMHYPIFTGNIIYLNLYFNASVIPQDKIQYLPLLATLLGELSTKKYSKDDLLTEISLHTGGISFAVDTFRNSRKPFNPLPYFSVKAKTLNGKLKTLLDLENEVLTKTNFTQRTELKEALERHHSQLQAAALDGGISLATMRLGSYLYDHGKYNELTAGLSYHQFIDQLVKNFDKEAQPLMNTLNELSTMLFSNKNLTIGVTADSNDYKVSKDLIQGFTAELFSTTPKLQKYSFSLTRDNEALLAPTQVQYVIQGANFREMGYEYSGKLVVLAKLLSDDFLLKNIRELGGAYGAWAQFSYSGIFSFSSYRDPGLGSTLDQYQKAPDYLKNLTVSDREMDGYIIGTIAKFDHPKTPREQGSAAFQNRLEMWTKEDKQKERDEVLSTSLEDIKGSSQMVKKLLSKEYRTVYGSEKAIEENKDRFNSIVKVLN